MEEITLKNKKNGILVLILVIGLYLAVIFNLIASRRIHPLVIFLSLLWLGCGWILLLGLKILKPQEALVLTLFGKYIGTLKGEGFYFVNPFCQAVNPAAKTQLNQSGDVKSLFGTNGNIEITSKKISLKVMTLNNARQKINDVLGNPVEIGIAVTWRVTDTAKAVFAVDNYKDAWFVSAQLLEYCLLRSLFGRHLPGTSPN